MKAKTILKALSIKAKQLHPVRKKLTKSYIDIFYTSINYINL